MFWTSLSLIHISMIKEAIVKLAAKQNLDYETAEASMDEIMGGKASPVQMLSLIHI